MYQFSPDALDQKVCLKYSHIFSCKLPVNGNWFSAKLTVRRISGCESFLLHTFFSVAIHVGDHQKRPALALGLGNGGQQGGGAEGAVCPRRLRRKTGNLGSTQKCTPAWTKRRQWEGHVDRWRTLGLMMQLSPFRRSLMSNSLWPRALQHARLPCPSPSPGVCSNSCPLSQWCHPSVSSSVAPFSCPQSFPASGSFLMSWLFTSGAQSIGT